MQLCDIFLGLGPDSFRQLLGAISLGKLRTYQLFERLKLRLHLAKLNTESLRKAAPRVYERLSQPDCEDLATEVAQAVLVSNLEMIKAVLDELGVPHEEGFFAKDLEASSYLTEGWQDRVFEKFKSRFSESLLLFYINHLGWEVAKTTEIYRGIPAGAKATS